MLILISSAVAQPEMNIIFNKSPSRNDPIINVTIIVYSSVIIDPNEKKSYSISKRIRNEYSLTILSVRCLLYLFLTDINVNCIDDG